MKMLLGTIAALGLALPTVAIAAENRSIDVQYSDLNLATPEGQKALERRIDKAAKQVCGADEARTGTRVVDRDARICVRNAKRQIETQIAAVIEKERLGG
ncbi:UrcA family protein [Citromicrobium bathyomarinum]|jgi:UrcA family protein|uniref:UrcA family protein n=1 Tax=Sphingomonadales TaxID=204457 RepID=UPI000C65208E|nr:UrcA family protein [Citromicrobium sp.]|tara:strand:- start:25 stop:324 length:300 start_codon:yes stop_codon:yes gene_type:complete